MKHNFNFIMRALLLLWYTKGASLAHGTSYSFKTVTLARMLVCVTVSLTVQLVIVMEI